jgi:hypothetical protein
VARNRREAARAIDIESAELGQWKSCFADPYDVLGVESADLGAKWFVRSPESHGWISASDLPENKQQAVVDRAAQYQLANARAG